MIVGGLGWFIFSAAKLCALYQTTSNCFFIFSLLLLLQTNVYLLALASNLVSST